MKKSLIILGTLAITLANAQDRSEYRVRVGINTDAPKASLHIGRHTGISEKSPQGLLLPHFDTEQRNQFNRKDLVKGLMIYNTKKNCIDWWDGDKWSCTDGNQPDYPPVQLPETTPVVFPEIELGNSKYWFSSIYDKDYLSIKGNVSTISRPTGTASLAQQQADGTETGGEMEPELNVQGIIPTEDNAVERIIPFTVTGSVSIPAFKTYARIPKEYTKDGREAVVVLSWDEGNANKNGYMNVKIYAQDKAISLKQLDLVAGQGADQMGHLMTSFKYPKNKAESGQPQSSWTGTYDLHLISAIPDKKFVEATTIGTEGRKYRHQFLYVPVMGPDGKIWLNNNLGADYANIHKPVFNPGQQATGSQDYNAYGSLFQWGRVADGHELMTWKDGTSKSVNKPTYRGEYSWYSSGNLTKYNENCPDGWETPNVEQYRALYNATNSGTVNIQNTSFFAGGLRISSSGYRYKDGGLTLYDTGISPWFWSRSEVGNGFVYRVYGAFSVSDHGFRSDGVALRCLKK